MLKLLRNIVIIVIAYRLGFSSGEYDKPVIIPEDGVVVHDCDYLAGSPHDPNRVTGGVLLSDIAIKVALPACSEAVRQDPTNSRFHYEFGRAFESANKFHEAVTQYVLAANHGYIAAQSNLGGMYERGLGVPQNSTEAALWYGKAASKGYAPARYSLSHLYRTGEGGKAESH